MSYRLHPEEQSSEPINSEVIAFNTWLSNSVQLDREGACLSHQSIENIMNSVWGYLGFVQLHCGINRLSLRLFRDMDFYGKYISFHVARKNSHGTINIQISAARKVLSFLSTSASDIERIMISDIKVWLSNVSRQLEEVAARPNQAPIILPPACLIVRKIDELRTDALRMIPLPGKSYTSESARLLHDACLACLMFSYLPPVRLVCLRTLQLPFSFGCYFKGCKREGCQGNRLALAGNQLTLVLNHYKVERR